ncbi:hypothetical protein [Streptomyces sp. NPDC052496]|uniref:hypothetical protein n=1 Tax=Streptomyces sp. NPDC052496 TaxID=3154951 RepID=UPI0034132F62
MSETQVQAREELFALDQKMQAEGFTAENAAAVDDGIIRYAAAHGVALTPVHPLTGEPSA